MTIALAIPIDTTNLQLDFSISTQLGIDPKQAKRRVTRHMMDKVTMFLHPDDPLLVIENSERVVWRFPIAFFMGTQGRLGVVGTVDVDAHSGQLYINSQKEREMIANVERLTQGLAHPATA